ncbi:stage III sporulation protein SpoIIIAA [Thermosporothrix hazakensis]|jgi:stage III sporulation protein SpoIIIAA/PHD/YefM family antitoxin component YafN of YafNO toxin-antitoxin module|uniref:Stage III sporulation protein SpoIIIAA n=2 Tax=Thermosporothrix TaxID=768650 RepID=A0A326TU43_THEHA|nr:R3H domain-containing nucleic acid-binding protein [Thermosporothrix hazakensis]PZW19378.1 stage III sporulation protein SpoIIIAA [Thermosporothrix hazakensis]BBH89849.1 single-stranded DNA-binding protein [Thermosporothrix sp. COM3]GCE48045.1 single-stranded DNA-binding protein [Thermosporothrix hazakensis]
MQHVVTDDLEALLATLPPSIRDAVNRLENRGELLEIVMDLGRLPEGRFPDSEVILGEEPVTYADLEYVVERIGEFGDDNRAGIERTLHRISALRNRKGRIVGLTCRIGRAVLGSIALIRDIVEQGQSILILGRPGVGKTTLLREVARVLADEANKRVIVVDTSNEIAGDGDIPHPGIGRARRMQVARTAEQHAVMIEAVENHMPQVIVIDEIGNELEAAAARTIAERGVQLVATAHGNSLGNLLVNPTLSDLVGGLQSVTLGDEEARRRQTQKSILERKAPPTFDVVVEQQSWDEVIVHRDVAETIDAMLRGQAVVAEERTRDSDTDHVSLRRITTGGMGVPGWGVNAQGRGMSTGSFRNGGSLRQINTSGSRGGGKTALQLPPLRALAATGTTGKEASTAFLTAPSPALMEEQEEEPEKVQQPALKTLRVYPFGVNRDRLMDAARNLRVPITITNHQKEADAVITLKNYYRRQIERLQDAEQEGKLIIILRNNTVMQMEQALARVFKLPAGGIAEREEEQNSLDDPQHDDPTRRALIETEDIIQQVLNKELTNAELPPANAYIRRLQHEMATRYNLISRSRGKEPNRRVKIFRARD